MQIYESLRFREKESNIKSHSFSSSMLIAEKLLNDTQLYKGYEKQLRDRNGDPLHILFIGFGMRNQKLALQILNLGHFLTKRKMRFTILDRNKKEVEKEWSFLAKQSHHIADIQFGKIDLQKKVLSTTMHSLGVDIKQVTHVYISLQDNFLDTIEGLELEVKDNVPIFVKINDNPNICQWLKEKGIINKNIKPYPTLDDVLTSEYVLNEILIENARKAHSIYLERKEIIGKRTESDKDWEELSTFKQESTRYQILHNGTKLMLLGLKKVGKEKQTFKNKNINYDQFDEYIEPYIDSLARVEHERWNTFHFLRGWKTAPLNDQRPKEELDKLKLHKCLVPWEDLSEEYKEYDRECIRNLINFYNLDKEYIIKDK